MKKILLCSVLALVACNQLADPSDTSSSSKTLSLHHLPFSVANMSSGVNWSSMIRMSYSMPSSSSSWPSYSGYVPGSMPGSLPSFASSSYSSSSYSSSAISSSRISSSSIANRTLSVAVADLNAWGYKDLGNGNFTIVGLDGDVGLGGDSYITDPANQVVGYCPPTLSGCANNWAMQSTYFNGAIGLNMHVSSWVNLPGTQLKRGFVGLWVFPEVDPSISGSNWFEKAKSIGMTSNSVVSLYLMYPAGAKLRVKLYGDGMSPVDPSSASPEYVYVGKGTTEWVTIPASSFVRPSTARSPLFSWGDVRGIGLERVVESSQSQTVFPSTEPAVHRLNFRTLKITALQ